MQEALIAAAMQWPTQGTPDNPKGWLITVATRRLTDQIRSDTARRLREQLVVSLIPADEQIALAADAAGVNERDETLDLYFMCCHPALSPASQVALTLRAVGGLTTGEIARAFSCPKRTMAQRLTRAKQTIRSAGRTFPDLTAQDRAARVPSVLNVLYLNVRSIWQCRCGSCPRHASTITRESLRRTDTQFGIEAGGGATAWLTSRIGLRTAATYYKALGPPGNFHGPPESDSSTRMCCVTSR